MNNLLESSSWVKKGLPQMKKSSSVSSRYGETRDYHMFNKMTLNRDLEIDTRKFSSLVEKIDRAGGNTEPIIVDLDMRVLDGQHRLEACKKTNHPVSFRIVDARGEEAEMLMIDLNTSSNDWSPIRYAEFYAKKGVYDYCLLFDAYEKWKDYFTFPIVAEAYFKMSQDYTRGIKSGDYKFSSIGTIILNAIVKVAESMDVTPNSINRPFIKALTTVMINNNNFNIDEFIHKCEMKRMKLYRSKQDNVDMIVEIYNWKRKKDRIE